MNDKKLHIIAGLVTALAVALPAYLESLNLFAGLWSALTSGIIVASIKEYYDYKTEGNTWDWWDWGCTIIGAAIVAVLIICLHYGNG
jgi:ABC-type transporter Mla maintaining outer membrane lipid asymmetry permease subunit MlaE